MIMYRSDSDIEAQLPDGFLSKLNIAMVGLNADEYIIFANQAAESCLKVELSQLLNTPVDTLFPNAKVLIQNARQHKIFQCNSIAWRRFSDPFDAKLSFSFFERSYPQNDNEISTLICFDEITKEQLNLLSSQTASQFEILSCYSGEIAHDLNNILNIISGHLEMLKLESTRQAKLDKRIVAALKGINRGRILAARLGHLAYYDKADASVCNINKIILDNTDLLQDTVAANVSISLNLTPNAIRVNLDTSHFIDVLFNLCINASNAMSGEGVIYIKTAFAESEVLDENQNLNITKYVCLSVEDSGCGIAQEIQEKIFEPFFTTKINNKGTGIGLNLVKSYMKIHDGFIKLKSEEGVGSCFSLYFPIVEENISESDSKEQNMEIEQKLSGKSVLVVDDEAPILFLLKEFLGIYGLRVQTAHSGREGLDLATSQNFDLILSDLVMPGDLDGAEFASLLLKQKPDSSIIFMSGYTDNRLIDKDELINIPVISKPFRKKELLNQVEVALC
ncbi:response regulator [Catenovulum sp. 2E275]|uniref:ATP-binding protein n=1 Tax=Catenovulum sp. 2E275 TaxID=2980497 RepID=UPI0021D18D97|nr:ATP-binding protein [Catenovulum sp. 2E275]MCU4675826.1 response regulator [Catenovulum sp. 2E275]